jgi:steroid 5-alpha reductase family enzyme
MLQEFFPVLDAVPMGDLWILLMWGLLLMTVWMFALWLWHFKLRNAGLLIFGWASGLAFLGVFYAIKADGYGPRRFLIATMALLWGGRLAWRQWSDRIGGAKAEDPRLAATRERWQNRVGMKFLLLFEWRALLAVVLSIPFALLALDPLQRITGYEWLGFGLWVVALWGEFVADSQLKHFKSEPGNEGRVCEDGLWYHSRHPNYFFEWLIWCAFFLSALATSYGAWTIICPLLMLILLRGRCIPMMEEHAIQSRGAEYAEYQRTTSMFVPWTKKSEGP